VRGASAVARSVLRRWAVGRSGEHEVVGSDLQRLGHVPKHSDDLWAQGDCALALLGLRRIVLAERAGCPHRQSATSQVETAALEADGLPRTQTREELREHEREPVSVLPPVVLEKEIALLLGERVRFGINLGRPV
jgi:hypothetical protein